MVLLKNAIYFYYFEFSILLFTCKLETQATDVIYFLKIKNIYPYSKNGINLKKSRFASKYTVGGLLI